VNYIAAQLKSLCIDPHTASPRSAAGNAGSPPLSAQESDRLPVQLAHGQASRRLLIIDVEFGNYSGSMVVSQMNPTDRSGELTFPILP
jgi:hypothetical protein